MKPYLAMFLLVFGVNLLTPGTSLVSYIGSGCLGAALLVLTVEQDR